MTYGFPRTPGPPGLKNTVPFLCSLLAGRRLNAILAVPALLFE